MAERKKYRCVTECTWLRRHWSVGSVYEGTETPLKHFELVTEETTPEPGPVTPGGGGCCNCAENDATVQEVRAMCEEVLES